MARIRHALVSLVSFAIFLSLVFYGISLLCRVFSSGSVSGPINKRTGYLACTVMFLKRCIGYGLLRCGLKDMMIWVVFDENRRSGHR